MNVSREHIQEIFSTYGAVKAVEFPMDRLHPHNGRGYAYVEFSNADEAENAMKHMDGGNENLFYSFGLHSLVVFKWDFFLIIPTWSNFANKVKNILCQIE